MMADKQLPAGLSTVIVEADDESEDDEVQVLRNSGKETGLVLQVGPGYIAVTLHLYDEHGDIKGLRPLEQLDPDQVLDAAVSLGNHAKALLAGELPEKP